jgi:hypothetical protein
MNYKRFIAENLNYIEFLVHWAIQKMRKAYL